MAIELGLTLIIVGGALLLGMWKARQLGNQIKEQQQELNEFRKKIKEI